jgi:ABC-type glycerol-3-phosphate transport system substrate-binding protein
MPSPPRGATPPNVMLVSLRLFTAVLLLIAAVSSGCGRGPVAATGRTIRVWSHQGQEAENAAMRAIAEAFNAAHAAEGLAVQLTFFPDFQYTEKVSIAAAARDLPDAFELDGPLVARFVDAGLLAPLDPWIDEATRADFLPTILTQGTIGGRLYALGAFDSAVVLYYDRELLARADVRPAVPDTGWTWPEFVAACGKLQAAGIVPLALHMNESADEWFTYAFSPVVWSGGGDLIAADGRRVRGVLASPENVRSLEAWQQLFTAGFAATDPIDPNPFGSGRVAMDWTGHWMARSHVATFGSRLGVMRLPRLGPESVAPCGSWCWGVAAAAARPELAAKWLRWVTDSRHGVEPMVRANGAVPARRSAFAAFPEYDDEPYRLFRQQLEAGARPRPRTPHYATLTRHFAAALRDIARGVEVADRLRSAADEIQREIDRRARTEDGL